MEFKKIKKKKNERGKKESLLHAAKATCH